MTEGGENILLVIVRNDVLSQIITDLMTFIVRNNYPHIKMAENVFIVPIPLKNKIESLLSKKLARNRDFFMHTSRWDAEFIRNEAERWIRSRTIVFDGESITIMQAISIASAWLRDTHLGYDFIKLTELIDKELSIIDKYDFSADKQASRSIKEHIYRKLIDTDKIEPDVTARQLISRIFLRLTENAT